MDFILSNNLKQNEWELSMKANGTNKSINLISIKLDYPRDFLEVSGIFCSFATIKLSHTYEKEHQNNKGNRAQSEL